jgi:hypothetical protein
MPPPNGGHLHCEKGKIIGDRWAIVPKDCALTLSRALTKMAW